MQPTPPIGENREPVYDVTKARWLLKECEECQLIDPAPVHWSKGALKVKQTWHWVAMDITHCNRAHFLTVIDSGPAQFAIWRRLPRQDATSVINQLKAVFYERGPLTEILTDNDTAFRSSLLKTFLDEWRVRLRFCCAYIPSGNGIIKRCHRTVKKDHCQKMVYYTESSILVQCHAKGWRVLCYSTSQYGLSVLHTAERNQWNIGADTQSTAGCLQTGWPSVGKESTWTMYHKI